MNNNLLIFLTLTLSVTGCLDPNTSNPSSSTASSPSSASTPRGPSQLVSDFKSADRTFSEAKSPGHSEISDTFMVLTGTKPEYNFKNISFKFTANKNEVVFNGETTTKTGSPYGFTYTASELDADTIIIKLTGTTPMTGEVFSVKNVNVVEPFERATLMYQKSKDQLLFLIIYQQTDMAKFSVSKPADFIIDPPTGTDLKDRGEPHAAFILKP